MSLHFAVEVSLHSAGRDLMLGLSDEDIQFNVYWFTSSQRERADPPPVFCWLATTLVTSASWSCILNWIYFERRRRLFVSTCLISTSSCRFTISKCLVSTFYFLSFFFIHRFCSVFLSVFWIVIGLPFKYVVLLSLDSFFLSFLYLSELRSNFLSFYGSLGLSAFSSTVYL